MCVYVCVSTQRALAGSPVALRVRAAAVDCGASTIRLAGDGAAATVVAGAANHSLVTVQLRDRYGNAVDPRRADAACGGRAVADATYGQGEGGGGTVELVADVDLPGTLSAPLTVAGRYTLQVGSMCVCVCVCVWTVALPALCRRILDERVGFRRRLGRDEGSEARAIGAQRDPCAKR